MEVRSASIRRAALALAAAGAVAGCAPVGPDFMRPAALVSPRFKEIAGWKAATPRAERAEGRLVERVSRSPTRPASRRRWRSPTKPSRRTRPTIGRRWPSSTRRAPGLSNRQRHGIGDAQLPWPVRRSTAEASGTWTLDVWGEARREIEAQRAGGEASAANLANATLAEQSALALAYIRCARPMLEDLLTRTVNEYKRSLTISQNQYNAGTAAKSDVITAQAQVLNAQAQLVSAGVTRAQSEHAVAVLMGRPPAGLTIPRGLALDPRPFNTGQPAVVLLERRPDVAAAEETMRQNNAEIGVAFAGYFPAVSLSGLLGYSGNPFAALYGPSNPVWSFGASLAQPLFNGGLTGAQVEAARETYDAEVATYRQTVLIALQQVEDVSQAFAFYPGGQGAGRGRPHLQAGDPDRDQRISGGHPGVHRSRCGRGSAAVGGRGAPSTQAQIQTDAVNLIVALGGGWSQSKLPDAVADSALPRRRRPPHSESAWRRATASAARASATVSAPPLAARALLTAVHQRLRAVDRVRGLPRRSGAACASPPGSRRRRRRPPASARSRDARRRRSAPADRR